MPDSNVACTAITVTIITPKIIFERTPRTFGPYGIRPDWQPYAFAIGAGIAVAVILSVAGIWLPNLPPVF
jgi:hypothetical protein